MAFIRRKVESHLRRLMESARTDHIMQVFLVYHVEEKRVTRVHAKGRLFYPDEGFYNRQGYDLNMRVTGKSRSLSKLPKYVEAYVNPRYNRADQDMCKRGYSHYQVTLTGKVAHQVLRSILCLVGCDEWSVELDDGVAKHP